MTDITCSFSGMDVAAHIDPSIPVECPECGAIRTIPSKQVWSDLFKYPSHKQADFVRQRRCYRRIGGTWQIVSE